ncbi:MAG: hypothetical protein H7338_02660 [Candidatus Sericytochromatia bacterium]|nr:hypothetical protein [Candidatus Sericytochromatia bacterium]
MPDQSLPNPLDRRALAPYDAILQSRFEAQRRFAADVAHLTRHPWLARRLLERLGQHQPWCDDLVRIQGGLLPAGQFWRLAAEVLGPPVIQPG